MPYSASLQAILRTLTALSVFLLPTAAMAQSLAVGLGLGIPIMDYITENVDREYRVTPQPGYYPVLKTYENALGSFHFNASLILDMELPVDIEIRFDGARMRWDKSRVTHVSCKPVDVINGSFSDAAAQYTDIGDVDEACLNRNTYETEKDISHQSISNLWFFHISGGVRYNILKYESWSLFAGLHLGLTLATQIDSDTWFGGNIDATLGAMVRLSNIIWLEFTAKLLFMVTQAPDNTQDRINHESQIGGNILTSLVQPNAYADFQLSIRFDFSEL